MTTSSRPPTPASPRSFGDSKRLTFVAAVLTCLALVQTTTQGSAQTASERLTSRPRPAAPAITTLAVGDEIRTKAGERRRVCLPDGSILYVNAASRVTLDATRRLRVSGGEVYVEAAARERDL